MYDILYCDVSVKMFCGVLLGKNKSLTAYEAQSFKFFEQKFIDDLALMI